MSMRKSTRQELRKCRELLRFLLRDKKCCFCKKPLQDDKSYAKDGDGQGSPICRRITIHHKDGNHQNDNPENKKLSHTTCHKSYHMRQRHRLAIGLVGEEVERGGRPQRRLCE
jgi:hypothetical protein